MAGLIIGHADHESVRIWIQGDRTYSRALVAVWRAEEESRPDAVVRSNRLTADADFTRVVEYDRLDERTEYRVRATFRSGFWLRRPQVLNGRFKTYPRPADPVDRFSFILGSCNISTVKVNNLLGLVAGMLGQRAADQSLKRKPRGRFRWLRTAWRQLLRLLGWGVTMLVTADTGFRQTGTPLLTSPFLRLLELFDNSIVHFERGRYEPAPGCGILVRRTGARGALLKYSLADGDWVRRSGPKASGRLDIVPTQGRFEPGEELQFRGPAQSESTDLRLLGVCKRADGRSVYFEDGEYEPALRDEVVGRKTGAKGVLIDLTISQGHWKKDPRPPASGTLVLTDVKGMFAAGDELVFSDPEDREHFREVGTVAQCTSQAPAFMIHAGDQIYFDFPFAHLRPSIEEYRRCYRECWFEDPWTRDMLSRCPQYMAIDDHEIVDNYASDFEPRQPRVGFRRPNLLERIKRWFTKPEIRRTPESYSVPALRAYGEYVNGRHPDTADGKYYYDFEYGEARFFVLDTRTERCAHPHPEDPERGGPRMIGNGQLKTFEDWLEKYPNELKFVVSSVPFVAQVRDTSDEGRARAKGDSKETSLDKWSGPPFEKQRRYLIDFIAERKIRNLVILAGDVHCCYHATMRIGHPYAGNTIHELAAGPIYQLRMGHRGHFFSVYEGRTENGRDFRSKMEQVHGGASAAMNIRVHHRGGTHEIDWEVIRTIPASEMSGPDSTQPVVGTPSITGCIKLER